MYVLRIEHPVHDFDTWKRVFDNPPVDRRAAGVRQYRVMRIGEKDSTALIDLDFDTSTAAEAFLLQLRELWKRAVGTLIDNPQARIVELVDAGQH